MLAEFIGISFLDQPWTESLVMHTGSHSAKGMAAEPSCATYRHEQSEHESREKNMQQLGSIEQGVKASIDQDRDLVNISLL